MLYLMRNDCKRSVNDALIIYRQFFAYHVLKDVLRFKYDFEGNSSPVKTPEKMHVAVHDQASALNFFIIIIFDH